MKTAIKKSLFTLLMIASTCLIFAQDKQTDAIKKKMSKEDQKTITEAETKDAEADKIMNDAIKQLEIIDKYRETAKKTSSVKEQKKWDSKADKLEDKSIKERTKAQKLYNEANKTFYALYKKYLKSWGDKAEPAKKTYAQEISKQADDIWKQSVGKRSKASGTPDARKAYKTLLEAYELENNAVALQIQALSKLLGLFVDEPVVVTEVKKDTVKVVENKTTEVKKDTVKIVENKTGNNNNNTNITTNETKKQKLIFKIQIAASDKPLELDKLRSIYPSNEVINNEIHNGMYKYTVGYYSSYEKAYEAKLKMKVKGSFIVAYRDGVRVENIGDVAEPMDKTDLYKSNNNMNNTNNANNNQNMNNSNPNGVEYRIQIGASYLPMSVEEQAKLNKTTLPVKSYKDGKSYEYTIGSFSTTQQAEQFQKSNGYNNSNSSIVKYQNNVEIK